MEPTAAALRQRAEHLSAALPPLLVEAERVAATIAQGVHGRRRVGAGESFWQYRRHQSGDPANAVDWRQSAKRQALYVRQNEWEAAESVWLWCDSSPSMRWRSRPTVPDKAERAQLLLLATAALLIRGGERVALLDQEDLPASGRVVLERLATQLQKSAEAGEAESLPRPRGLPRFAQVVLIGDLLSPLAEIETAVAALAGSGVKGHLLQVLDPAEIDLPFSGRTRFEGLEGEAAITIGRVEGLRSEYFARLQAQIEGLRDCARRTGWSFASHRTDRPPQTPLLTLYGAISGGRGW